MREAEEEPEAEEVREAEEEPEAVEDAEAEGEPESTPPPASNSINLEATITQDLKNFLCSRNQRRPMHR